MKQQQPPNSTNQPTTGQAKTNRSRESTRNFLEHIWGIIDGIGKAVTGELWRDVYLSIQDAIALGFLLVFPRKIISI